MSWAPFIAPNRDLRHSPGRAKTSGGTIPYCIPGYVVTTPNNSYTLAANKDYYGAFFLSVPSVVDQLAFEVTTGQAGNGRIGIYVADRDRQPVGGPLADSGDISVSATGVKTYAPASPLYLSRGLHLTVLNMSVASVAVREFRGGIAPSPIGTSLGADSIYEDMSVARTYAAFPTPGTQWSASASSLTVMGEFVVMRVTAA